MSNFYAVISESARRTQATARGHKSVATQAASWAGAIETRIWHDDETGVDRFEVRHITWQGQGVSAPIASGIVGSLEDHKVDF